MRPSVRRMILRMRKITQSAGRTREGHAIQQTGRSPVFICLAEKCPHLQAMNYWDLISASENP
ncbi:hypothetical protein NGH03_23180, partial [Escherichia coli]|nr:hypothetical protein [Escherichia coli]